ncbi:hypothetical protein [Pararobbsia alpina]
MRIETTFDEHAAILELIMRRSATEASLLIRSHILESKSEVQKVTVQMLREAREAMLAEQ